MTRRRSALLGAALLVATLLAALLILPAMVKDTVTSRVQEGLDDGLDAQVAWGRVSLTFFRDFPDLTLGLQDLTVVGEEPFAGDTLASVATLRLVLDLGSVIRSVRGRGDVVVRSLRLEDPELRLTVLEDGRANWDILPEATAESTAPGTQGRPMAVELEEMEIQDGRLSLDNQRSGLQVVLDGYQHSLTGRASRERLTATTRIHAEDVDVRLAGIPYLAGTTLDFVADLEAEPEARRVTLMENTLRLNDLLLAFQGEVTAVPEGLALDLSFEAPRTELGPALSLVPALYTPDFASLETAGSFTLSGRLQGDWGEEAFPAFSMQARVQDGRFRYPGDALPAREISADLTVTNPGGDPDATVVELSRLHLVVGDQPLDASARLRFPLSDPELTGQVQGTMDLGALARTVRLPEGMELAGSVTADVSAQGRRSDLESARYERIEAQGRIAARQVMLPAGLLPQPLSVEEMEVDISPRRADLRSFQGRVGSSDLTATGSLDNLLGFWLQDEPLTGRGVVHSTRFVLDEWRSPDEEVTVIPVPAGLDLVLDGTVDELLYGELVMNNARGRVQMAEERLTFQGFTLETLGGRIGMNGSYETQDPTRPTFDLDLTMDSLDLQGASEAFLTVRMLAPVARFARGSFSARLDLAGALGTDMVPAFDVLTGAGSLLTSPIAIQDFPLLQRLGETLQLPRLINPTLEAVRSSVRIADGRLFVQPFRVRVAGLNMAVEGSNGLDRSLDYTLGLTLPRALLGGRADRLVQDLVARAGQAGVDLATADSLRLAVQVGGTLTEPSLDLGLREAASSARRSAEEAVGAAVTQRLEAAQQRLDSARNEAQERVQAQADSLVADAEARAAEIRAEGRRLADAARQEADRRISELLARATNPLARAAAQPAADRLRREAAERADMLVSQADERAEALVAEARRRAEALQGG